MKAATTPYVWRENPPGLLHYWLVEVLSRELHRGVAMADYTGRMFWSQEKLDWNLALHRLLVWWSLSNSTSLSQPHFILTQVANDITCALWS